MKLVDFRLRKLKVDKNNVIIEYQKNGSDESITSNKKIAPHPDMRDKLNKLREYVLEVFCIDDDQLENVVVNGISISERKDKKILSVQSVFTTQTNSKASLVTPIITFEDETYHTGTKLEAQVNIIAEEAFNYLFGKKQAQQSLELETKEE